MCGLAARGRTSGGAHVRLGPRAGRAPPPHRVLLLPPPVSRPPPARAGAGSAEGVMSPSRRSAQRCYSAAAAAPRPGPRPRPRPRPSLPSLVRPYLSPSPSLGARAALGRGPSARLPSPAAREPARPLGRTSSARECEAPHPLPPCELGFSRPPGLVVNGEGVEGGTRPRWPPPRRPPRRRQPPPRVDVSLTRTPRCLGQERLSAQRVAS